MFYKVFLLLFDGCYTVWFVLVWSGLVWSGLVWSGRLVPTIQQDKLAFVSIC